MLDTQNIIFFLDIIGIVAFAFTGVSLGIKKKLDVFGLLLIGITSAIGGGILRDLILSKVPFAIAHLDYLGFAYVASFISILAFYFKLNIPSKLIILADTLGLGAFAMAGTTVSLDLNLSIFHTILFSVLTAVGGGIIRDILINEIPFILKYEVYATAAAIGGLITHLLFILGIPIQTSVLIGLVFTILLRFFSIKRKLNLPIIRN